MDPETREVEEKPDTHSGIRTTPIGTPHESEPKSEVSEKPHEEPDQEEKDEGGGGGGEEEEEQQPQQKFNRFNLLHPNNRHFFF